MAGAVKGGPSYFDGAKIGRVQKRFLWLAALCYVFDQMDLFTVSYVQPVVMKNWGLTVQDFAQINSLTMWGMFLGAILGGWLSDKIGRKKSMIATIIVFSCASIANGLAINYYTFAVSRFITGFGVVAMVVIAMVYIAEMMPSENRGRYQALTIACGTCGIPLGAQFARWVVPMGPETWRYVFILGGSGILLVILAFFWLKESPRWLVSKGRVTDAENLIEGITGKKIDLSAEANKVLKKSSNLEALKVMFSRMYLKRTTVLFILCIGVTLGAFYLNSFYTFMLQGAGFSLAMALTIATAGNWGVPFGDLSASFISDRGGRKIPIVIYCLLAGLMCILAGYILIPAVLIVVSIIRNLTGGGSMSMYWTYLAESYPTHIRANASGMLFGTVRVIAAMSMLTMPFVLKNYGWVGAHWVNALVFIIPALVALVWGEKTSKRTLEDIAGEEGGKPESQLNPV